MIHATVVPSTKALKDFVGKPFGPSDWVRVDAERIRAFADATNDHQWIHVDAERAARESPFGGPVAHGYLTISLVPALLSQVFRVEGAHWLLNYGMDRMRFHAPVPAGAQLRLTGEVKAVRDLPRGVVRVVLGLRLEIEGTPRPACAADVVYLFYP